MELINNIYNVDAREALKELDSESVDLVVCSPPYDNLRDYEKTRDGKNPEWNFEVFKEIAKELTRVLKDGGVIVWNVFDETVDGSRTGSSLRQALYFKEVCGLNIYDYMFHEKIRSAFPGVRRYHPTVEFAFILSKGRPNTVNFIWDVKNKSAGEFTTAKGIKKDGSYRTMLSRIQESFSRRTCIWRYTPGKRNISSNPTAKKHPARMNKRIALDHIYTWSNEGDVVLDPLAGSGTTLEAAKDLGRNYIGFDICEEYCNDARKRLEVIPSFENEKDTEEPSVDDAA